MHKSLIKKTFSVLSNLFLLTLLIINNSFAQSSGEIIGRGTLNDNICGNAQLRWGNACVSTNCVGGVVDDNGKCAMPDCLAYATGSNSKIPIFFGNTGILQCDANPEIYDNTQPISFECKKSGSSYYVSYLNGNNYTTGLPSNRKYFTTCKCKSPFVYDSASKDCQPSYNGLSVSVCRNSIKSGDSVYSAWVSGKTTTASSPHNPVEICKQLSNPIGVKYTKATAFGSYVTSCSSETLNSTLPTNASSLNETINNNKSTLSYTCPTGGCNNGTTIGEIIYQLDINGNKIGIISITKLASQVHWRCE